MPKDCFTPEELDDYLHGILEAPEAARIEEHLAHCDACVAVCRQLDSIADAWAAWTGNEAAPQDLVAAGPVGRGSRGIYVSGGQVIRARIRDMRVEERRLHFTFAIDEETMLPNEPVLDLVFLETLEIRTVPLAPLDRRDLEDGIECAVDIPRDLRRRFRARSDAIGWRIRSGQAPA